MILKYMSGNNFLLRSSAIISSQAFLLILGALIFCLSIFLRSTIDIGPDTGVYLDLGKKVAEGKRYYYDFFESNFPLSFWIYALQFRLSNWIGISPIIMSEIFIDCGGLLSILWSAQILKKSTIYNNRAHYNLIIIAYFLGFFLRANVIQLGEFGTKSSFLLLCLFPYISFSFERLTALTRGELMQRGVLMGLIPCFKPHYLIFPLIIETYRFRQKKSPAFFIELDKLAMLLVGVMYLFLMMKFTPEFFEFVVPMWPKIYEAYDNWTIFWRNIWHWLGYLAAVYCFIFLPFSRLKFSANDKILFLFFVAASLVLILENIGTIDQIGVIYSVFTICFLKIGYDLISSQKFSFRDNKFIILVLVIWPLFDLEILPRAIIGGSGFINVWWAILLVYPLIFCYNLRKNQPQEFVLFKTRNFTAVKIFAFIAFYFLLLLANILILKYLGAWAFVTSNLFSLFFVLFFFEKFYARFEEKFSSFSVFIITTSFSCLFYSYFAPLTNLIPSKYYDTYPNKLSAQIAHYSSIYAPKKQDGFLIVSDIDVHGFPIMNYLGKTNYHVHNVINIMAKHGFLGASEAFPQDKDRDRIFTLSYLFENFKAQLRNQDVKILFINNNAEIMQSGNGCLIGFLEYYFSDPEFRKIFFENFRFENRILTSISKENPIRRIVVTNKEEPTIFDDLKPSSEKIRYDFEVYVRR